MFRHCISLLLFSFYCLSATHAEDSFIAISYHSVVDKGDIPDADSVTVYDLGQQLQWLLFNGYHPISIDDLIASQKGLRKLPDKAVLITFDDAYADFYRLAFPLLKAMKIPAVLAVVGKWIDTPKDKKVSYGDKFFNREKFLTWEQIKELSDSGLIEIASHSYDHHHAIEANPSGSIQPAMVTREYKKTLGRYETHSEYINRIKNDLSKNSERIYNKTGKRPRVMVWPYGEYNSQALKIASELHMPITITLSHTLNSTNDLRTIGRFYYGADMRLTNFIYKIQNYEKIEKSIIRSIRVDLDRIYDPDPQQIEKNLDKLIDRIYKFHINTVILQGFADQDAKGYAKELYFPNRHLPVKADLMNRVAWQLFKRGGVKVYAWMPIIGFDFGDDSLLVKTIDKETGEITVDKNQYKRSSPFNPIARQKILEIFEDLGSYVPVQGIAFHDDGVLTDYEDASIDGITFLKANDLPDSILKIRSDPALMSKWTRSKSQALINFTKEIEATVRRYRPQLKTMRSMFALPVLKPESEAWFAQNYEDFLEAYDYVALMAMPHMENADNPEAWLKELVDNVKAKNNGINNTIFELQTVDWRENNAPISSTKILKQLENLASLGIKNFCYYPDNMFDNHPDISVVKEGISTQSYLHTR